jgi:hypothetical protein
MRDVRRIDRILNDIKKLWLANEDYRFYQLLINAGLMPDSGIWNVEDDEVEEHLKKIKKNWKVK